MYYLPVMDAKRNEPLGRLGNINGEGILLLTNCELPLDRTYSVSIRIPEHLGFGRPTLEMEIQPRWSQQEKARGLHAIGCAIASLEPQGKDLIGLLIARIGFSDGSKKIFLKNDANVFLDTGESDVQ